LTFPLSRLDLDFLSSALRPSNAHFASDALSGRSNLSTSRRFTKHFFQK
jgi:hypothetical protein